jgi:invasion protein IalB
MCVSATTLAAAAHTNAAAVYAADPHSIGPATTTGAPPGSHHGTRAQQQQPTDCGGVRDSRRDSWSVRCGRQAGGSGGGSLHYLLNS